MKKKEWRFSLAAKASVFVSVVILAISLAVVVNGYLIQSSIIDDMYMDWMEKIAVSCRDSFDNAIIERLVDIVLSDEFQQLRRKAVEEESAELITDYLDGIGAYEELDPMVYSMLDAYNSIEYVFSEMRDTYEMSGIYMETQRNGVTYSLVTSSGRIFRCGGITEPVAGTEAYGDNATIPSITYQVGNIWFTSSFIAIEGENGQPVARVVIDLDVDRIVVRHHRFLMRSIIFVVILTLVSIFLCIFLIRWRMVRPLRALARGTRAFSLGAREDRVIHLKIKSHDEIQDLYQEIRNMQMRIISDQSSLEKVTAEKEHINTELALAGSIQSSMLPSVAPDFTSHPEFDLAVSIRPAREVGGDFYDFFMIDPDHMVLVMADVSGKGIPAALFMMASRILVYDQAMTGLAPNEILSTVNQRICQVNRRSKMFVTVWIGILDLRSGVMTCSNAGHEFPVIRGDDGVFSVFRDPHGFVVGGLARSRYTSYEIQLHPGDVLLVYTDGLPEATDTQSQRYGLDRLTNLLNSLDNPDPDTVLSRISADVESFVGSAEQYDDLTMLCLRFHGRS